MKIIQCQTILVVLIIIVCFVNCDRDKGDKKDEKSKNDQKKCKNHTNNGRGKGNGKDKGSGENDCDDSENNFSVNIPLAAVPTKITVPEKLVKTTEPADNGNENVVVLESEPLILESNPISSQTEAVTDQYDNIADVDDPITEETYDSHTVSSIQPDTNNDGENKPNTNEENDTEFTPTVNTVTIRPNIIKPTTPKPSRGTTKHTTKKPFSGRPAGCIICRHPPTSTKKPSKHKTVQPIQPNGSNNFDGKQTNNNKYSNFDSDKPTKGFKSQGCFTNEHNYWFGIHLSNRINTFYRPANYFRSGQNYWYGLFLPNMQAAMPNGCLVCNQLLGKHKTSSPTGKNQETKRVAS